MHTVEVPVEVLTHDSFRMYGQTRVLRKMGGYSCEKPRSTGTTRDQPGQKSLVVGLFQTSP